MKKCCICGCTIKGWGNNPWGALDKNGEPIKWNDNDVCCDSCNMTFVLSGRLSRLERGKKNNESTNN